MLLLPGPSVAYTEQEVPLNGETYVFTYRFNSRADRWYLDISDAYGDPIIYGIGVVEGSNLTGHISALDILGGDLYTLKLSAGEERLGRDNFGIGKTHVLSYVGFDEEL